MKLFRRPEVLQSILPLVCAIALLVYAIRPEAHAYVTFSRNSTPVGWDLSAIPNGQINWVISSSKAPPILRESIILATQQWSKATSGVLKFGEGTGGIEFRWSEDSSDIFDPLFLAYTTETVGPNFNITSARITVNAANYSWHRGAPCGVGGWIDNKRCADLDGVILHELGHALGLDHSDKNTANIVGNWSSQSLPTMNSVIYPGAETLHTDDIAGIRSIYLHDASVPEPEISISGSPAKGPRPLIVGFMQTCGDETTTWDFGDGHTFTGATPSHKFVAPGTYTVTATFNGNTSTMTVEVDKKKARQVRVKKIKTRN